MLLVPAHTSPFKARHDDDGWLDPGPGHRLQMCRLACDRVDGMSVCSHEIDRGGVSYTVDTLRALHASHPEAELTLIVGADVAGTLGSWREPQELFELAELAIARRPGAVQLPPPELPPRRLRFLEMQPIAVSSSLVRERVARGEPIESLVGAPVTAYIAEHGLYRVVTTTPT